MYKLIDGAILAQVGGEYILVATRRIWGKCPNIKPISPLFAAYWQGISQGMNETAIIQELLQKTKVKEMALRDQLYAFLREMKKEGYLYEEESI